MKNKSLIPVERIERRIFLIRGHKVMLSNDLAELYEVEPRILVQAVKRNIDRFPEDFMFQLSQEEFSILKSQIVISSWGGCEGLHHMLLPNRVSLCYRAYSGPNVPFRLISKSCGHLFVSEGYLHLMLIWLANLMPWRRSMMPNSK